ncbi:hypothetical protein CFBP6624_18475 [Agrobacterium tumefaciens]|uniref:Uncharacterized protein n=1 Tax=Agrobacterium tumefaciens TaxID=358 RepID=A0AAE6EM74_AGRTU|nr:hypothetical protein CFBP6624_18475 [Agrobacterium tumefaciens]
MQHRTSFGPDFLQFVFPHDFLLQEYPSLEHVRLKRVCRTCSITLFFRIFRTQNRYALLLEML